MKRRWTPEELAAQWTLSADEFALLDTKTDHNRLGFALLLKFFTIEGRFPRSSSELPEAAVVHVSRQVQVAPGRLRFHQWRGRSIKDHRAQIRAHLGFRYARVEDAEALATWLAGHPEASTASFEQLGAIVGQRCRELHLEPPAPDRVQRLVRSAVRRAHERFCEELWSHLPPSAIEALDALLDPSADDDAPGLSLAALKADPGRPTLDSVLTEIAKLGALRAVGLPPELFRGAPPKLLARLRQRAAAEPPRELRAHPEPLRYTLLATLCYLRLQEITDNLVELLIGVIHKINFRAEQRVEQELLAELRRVPDKHDLLYDLAAASLANPDSLVRDVVFPVVGEQTLWALVAEQQALGGPYRKRVHTVMRASYAGHYRQMLPHVLTALEFRSNNVLHQPVIRALELLKQFAGRQTQFYQAHTQAPIEGVVRPKWRKLLLEAGRHEGVRVPRINYEICVLETLREKLRCKEVWVVGADRWRNPDEDLPLDFDQRRDHYYAALVQPREPEAFIEPLRERVAAALDQLNRGLPRNRAVHILGKAGGWIKLTPLDALPEPVNLDQLKGEVGQRWPMTSLLDVLKETDLRVGFTERFTSVASREMLDRETLQRRLLLCLYGLGTNTGLKRVSSGRHGEQYRDLLYVRRRFLHREALRAANADVVNAILTARQPALWGEGTTACASDSKQFGAWDQNLMTEWHIRYGGRGIMIYWHVEKKSACIYSQLKRCSSGSEHRKGSQLATKTGATWVYDTASSQSLGSRYVTPVSSRFRRSRRSLKRSASGLRERRA